MCSPVYLLMLPVCEKLPLLTGIVTPSLAGQTLWPARLSYTAWARVPSNSIASCGAVSCLINTLADGAEGLHFSVIYDKIGIGMEHN